ncbi:hypothetical protein L226DRAFT_611892 [Lentinus tigrinus ALCF2SS1-7]|uniref:uncharacterized protein n=1 Tax=Lentinus tigrinus ALCF2SS1-7 TaxID=1328758 RepID=UPI0011662314|nr:hypothetical protein L226DRAFT_611892 [Lentinus tigrinus ALCF2SS1-7]
MSLPLYSNRMRADSPHSPNDISPKERLVISKMSAGQTMPPNDNVPPTYVLGPLPFDLGDPTAHPRQTGDGVKALGEAKVVVPDESSPSSLAGGLADDLALLSFSSEKAATIADADKQTDEDSVVITPTAPPGLSLDETTTTIASAEHASTADNAVDAVRCSLSPLDAYILPTELPDQNRLGTGNHSTVFRAPFVLELDRGSGAEAVMYSTFPADLMDANGPDSPSGIRAAAPEAQEDMPADDVALAKTDQRNVASTEENRPPPVVPRFYGYYLPIGDDDTLICNTHSKCKEDGKCEVDWPSRILLVEECGTPIEPRDWTYQQR